MPAAHGFPTEDEMHRDLPMLCRRVATQLDEQTWVDLRWLIFRLANSAKGTPAESWLIAMYDNLEPRP